MRAKKLCAGKLLQDTFLFIKKVHFRCSIYQNEPEKVAEYALVLCYSGLFVFMCRLLKYS